MATEDPRVVVDVKRKWKKNYGTLHESGLARSRPSMFMVHGAIVIGNMIFAGGGIMGKLGIAKENSMVFEAYREGFSFLFIFGWLVFSGGVLVPDRSDLLVMLVVGIAYFFNQAFWYIGIKLSTPVIGATWQSFGTTVTCAFAVIAGREGVPRGWKAFGVVMALFGTLYMVGCDSANAKSPGAGLNDATFVRAIGGHLSFFLNIFGMAIYFVICNTFGTKYPALSLIAWSTFTTSILMVITASFVVYNEPLLNLMCTNPDMNVSGDCVQHGWSLTQAMRWPLAYEIFFCSCVAWPLQNWANQYTDASVVAVYVVFQPITSCIISTVVVLAMGELWANRYGLHVAGAESLGIVFIMIGLVSVYHSQRNASNRLDPSPTDKTCHEAC